MLDSDYGKLFQRKRFHHRGHRGRHDL